MELTNDLLLAAADALEFQAEYEWRDVNRQIWLREQAQAFRDRVIGQTQEMPLALVEAGLRQARAEVNGYEVHEATRDELEDSLCGLLRRQAC